MMKFMESVVKFKFGFTSSGAGVEEERELMKQQRSHILWLWKTCLVSYSRNCSGDLFVLINKEKKASSEITRNCPRWHDIKVLTTIIQLIYSLPYWATRQFGLGIQNGGLQYCFFCHFRSSPSWWFSRKSKKKQLLYANQRKGQLFAFFSPPSRCATSQVISLYIGNNNFRGPIPRSISRLINLISLDLSNLNTEATVDFCSFSHFKSLKDLNLAHLNTTTVVDLNAVLSCPNSIGSLGQLRFRRKQEFSFSSFIAIESCQTAAS